MPAANGVYSIVGLPTGSFRVQTFDPLFAYTDEAWNNIPCPAGCNFFTGDPIAVTAGASTRNIDFELEGFGVLSGTVRETFTGNPLAGINVQIYDATGALVATAITGANGTYSVTDLPLAHYTLLTVDPGGTYPDELYLNIPCDGCDPTTGRRVRVFAGLNNFGHHFALNPGGCSPEELVQNLTVTGLIEAEACDQLTLAGVEVGFLGVLSAVAGETVAFDNGFRVLSGGRLNVVINPALKTPP